MVPNVEKWRENLRKEWLWMFTGEHNHSLDPKNRIAMPAKLREELGESFMISRSIRGNCIKVYSMEEWEIFLDKIKQ